MFEYFTNVFKLPCGEMEIFGDEIKRLGLLGMFMCW